MRLINSSKNKRNNNKNKINSFFFFLKKNFLFKPMPNPFVFFFSPLKLMMRWEIGKRIVSIASVHHLREDGRSKNKVICVGWNGPTFLQHHGFNQSTLYVVWAERNHCNVNLINLSPLCVLRWTQAKKAHLAQFIRSCWESITNLKILRQPENLEMHGSWVFL